MRGTWMPGAVVALVASLAVAGLIGTRAGGRVSAQSPIPTSPMPVSTVTVPHAQRTPRPEGCPPGGAASGVLFIVFRPGTPQSEQAAAHAAAGAMLGERSEQQIPREDGSIAVTATVPPGSEAAALQIYRSRPSVRVATRVAISPPVCLSPSQGDDIPLVRGCTNVALTWPVGTLLSVVGAAVTPAGQVESIFKLDPVRGRFRGFSPTAPAFANDYTAVESSLEAVFICMRETGTLNRPRP